MLISIFYNNIKSFLVCDDKTINRFMKHGNALNRLLEVGCILEFIIEISLGNYFKTIAVLFYPFIIFLELIVLKLFINIKNAIPVNLKTVESVYMPYMFASKCVGLLRILEMPLVLYAVFVVLWRFWDIYIVAKIMHYLAKKTKKVYVISLAIYIFLGILSLCKSLL